MRCSLLDDPVGGSFASAGFELHKPSALDRLQVPADLSLRYANTLPDLMLRKSLAVRLLDLLTTLRNDFAVFHGLCRLCTPGLRSAARISPGGLDGVYFFGGVFVDFTV
jgi:hypothetical protein